MSPAQDQPNFKHFNKYDFVKSLTVSISDPKIREEEERKAVIIADTIEETQVVLFEHLATKEDLKDARNESKKDIANLRSELKKDLTLLEHKLTIKLTAIMAALLTFLPLIINFLQKLFS